jgi:hypothetical protein
MSTPHPRQIDRDDALGWPLAALACVGFTLISRSHVDCIDLAAEATGEARPR